MLYYAKVYVEINENCMKKFKVRNCYKMRTTILEGLNMSVPDEFSLLSLFECDPKLLDSNVSYFYNEATYEFNNSANERFVVSICPSYSDIKIQVYATDNNELLSLLDFKDVANIEILSDKKEESKIRIYIEGGLIKINFKPRFKVFLNLISSELT